MKLIKSRKFAALILVLAIVIGTFFGINIGMQKKMAGIVQGQANAVMGLLTVARSLPEYKDSTDVMKLSLAREEALHLLDSGAFAKKLYSYHLYAFDEYFARLSEQLTKAGNEGQIPRRDQELAYSYTNDYLRLKQFNGWDGNWPSDNLTKFEKFLLKICY